jgi:hypothetical protein
VLPISAVAVSGCAVKFTGGGTIPSTDNVSTDQANFGFTYKVTNQSTGAGQAQGAYHDPYAPGYPLGGLALKFNGLLSGDTTPGYNNCMDGVVNYTSQNPSYPGSGQAFLKACDDGEPGYNDVIEITVLSGRYSGYDDGGFLTGGNLQAH